MMPKLYHPKNHRRRAPLSTALEDLAWDARQAPAWLKAGLVLLALAAVLAVRACRAQHSLVAPEDRAGLRTYEAR
jgi:hypothetical protein